MENDTEPNFSEDEAILARLTDPEDVEAFTHLMENAHREGQSAASFIREEPGRTSRRAILKLCVKDQKEPLGKRMTAAFRSVWGSRGGGNGR